jgi:putative transposase
MARIARVVVPGCWHHVTQRGNHQQTVFFDDAHRRCYLELVRHYCERHSVRITGYCLMGNHVHLLAIPSCEGGLARALGRAHNDYSRWLNVERQETGHLWQNRFYSCALDEAHQWQALRYVELNPVRAGLVAQPAEWRWSSAAAHIAGRDPAGMIDWPDWRDRWSPEGWRQVLENGVDEADLIERIREATRTGRPAAGTEFLERIEAGIGRPLRPLKRGPKKKGAAAIGQMQFEVV